MCGIAGFIGEEKNTISAMVASLRHRGPDGEGMYVGDGISFGHARLAILDPRPEGNQPMWSADRKAVIVYNGEIFNYQELRIELGCECSTGTDTEVLLHLYQHHGISFVSKLRGMFAFGLYDVSRQTLFLARDPSGIKPLYFSQRNGRPIFASEMRAVLRALPKCPALNLRSLSRYLQLQYVPGPETMCEGIELLPQGTVITWTKNSLTRQIIESDFQGVPTVNKSAFKKTMPELMDAVVRDHLISDKPVGLFLSGGLDSSILLHHMVRHSPPPVRTFTVRFDVSANEQSEKFNADADIALKTAAHYGTNHTEIIFTAAECRDLYRQTARAIDSPNANAVAVAQYVLSQKAKSMVDVVLLGSGSDELFGGYPRYRVLRLVRLMSLFPLPIRELIARGFGWPKDLFRGNFGPLMAERLLTRPQVEIQPVLTGNWFDPDATTSLFEGRFRHLPRTSPVRSLMELDRTLWLPDESLRLSDAVTMASGLEGRIPFLDPRIRQIAGGLPIEWNVGFRKTKCLLREAYRDKLPPHLFALKKTGFFPPLAKWLRRECGTLIDEVIASKNMLEYFDVKMIQTLHREHCNGAYHLHLLSTLIQLHFWFTEVYES